MWRTLGSMHGSVDKVAMRFSSRESTLISLEKALFGMPGTWNSAGAFRFRVTAGVVRLYTSRAK